MQNQIVFLDKKLYNFHITSIGDYSIMKLLNMKNILKKTIFFPLNILSNHNIQLMIFVILAFLIKSILFVVLLDPSFDSSINSASYSFVYLTFIVFIYSFGYIFSEYKRTIFYIISSFIYSILLLTDLWYFRINGDFFGINQILFSGTFNPSQKSLINFKPIDLTLFIDTVFMILLLILKKAYIPSKKDIKKLIISLSTSLVMFITCYIYFAFIETSVFGNKSICSQRSPLTSVQASGPLGHHLVESITSANEYLNSKIKVDSTNQQLIQKWFKNNNENLEDNEFKSIAKGKNVIFLQIESLENFVINQKTNNQEITPFLNKLSKEGLYFNNIYEQNNGGHSIDCDFLVNTSIYPSGNRVSAIAYGENIYPNSFPRILSKYSYTTITSRPEKPGDFNWMKLHKNCFGVNNVFSILDYNNNEKIGYGLSDRSSLIQFADKLKNLSSPFFAQTCTLTSHGPFNLDSKYRQLNLPIEIDTNYLGGYFESLHYTDAQLEMFFKELETNNLLNNSIIVIYGDHTGVHKYYNDSIQNLNYEENWWKDFDHKIPLIIYSPGITPAVIKASGGQVDILPTLCYILGIDDDLYRNTSMGRILVNTNIDATVIKDTTTNSNTIKGTFKNYKEERHLLDAYTIGEKIIQSNYFARP